MKKFIGILLMNVFFIFLCPAQENKPIEGYDGFPWGTTIRKVTKKYPYGRDTAAANLREYCVTDKTSSYPIVCSKTFRFYERKLYFGETDYSYYWGEGGEEQLAKLYDDVLSDLKKEYNLGTHRSSDIQKLSNDYIAYISRWVISLTCYIELVKVENPSGIQLIAVMFYNPLERSKAEQ